jgi:hypothetical protein
LAEAHSKVETTPEPKPVLSESDESDTPEITEQPVEKQVFVSKRDLDEDEELVAKLAEVRRERDMARRD